MYRNIVRKTLRTGTTCAAYFATLHKEATIKLIDIMRDLGQRGWVGKVCMNQNAPSWYQETPEQSIMDTKAIIQYVRDTDAEAFANASIEKQKRQLDSIYHTCGLVEACITPRFAPHCTAESMKQMGQLAVEEGVKNSKLDSRRSLVPIQSHLSENRKEVEWVRSLFPEATSYTDVYDRAGLLTPRTIMAHGIYLSKEERECIKKTGSAIAHCAHSNFNLRSGVLNVRRLLDEGIKVALGTDVSGGHSSSMLDAMRSAITASHVICMMQEDDTAHAQLSIPEVLYMATVGGAMAMGLEDRVGSLLNVGYEMDALLVDVYANDQALLHISDHTDRLPSELSKDTGSTLPIQKWYLDMLEKFIMCGDDRHILYVWVRGRCVAENKTTNMDIIHK
jgi:guanine deaminase